MRLRDWRAARWAQSQRRHTDEKFSLRELFEMAHSNPRLEKNQLGRGQGRHYNAKLLRAKARWLV